MKHFLCGIALLLLSTTASASIGIISGQTYRLASNSYPNGCISITTTGILYPNGSTIWKQNYTESYTYNATNLWIITEEKTDKYSIKNYRSKEYLTYNGVKSNRYIGLSSTLKGDSSLWTINTIDEGVAIMNVYNSVHRLDISKKDTTINDKKTKILTCGTYTEGLYNQNTFKIYDIKGKLVSTTPIKVPTVADFVDNLLIGEKPTVCDTTKNSFLQSIPTSLREENNYTAKINFNLKDPANHLYIDNKLVTPNSDFTFKSIGGETTYQVSIKANNETLITTPLNFTFLPIVEITVPTLETYGDTYKKGKIRVINPESSLDDSIYNIKVRYRGGSARDYLKKPYNVKLIDKNDNSIDRNILGIREDNNWILDAMAVDQLRCRNRVSTDFWQEFASAPYYKSLEPKMICGTRGKFVEVFKNGVYTGIFCLTDKVDRKQLKLKKYKEKVATESDTIRGVLYKASQWDYSVWMGYDSYSHSYPGHSVSYYNNNNENWSGWECKYPDLGDGQSIDWGPLYNATNLVASGSDTQFKSEVPKLFDLPVMRDYYLFIELMFAQDNNGKNTFMFSYDKQKDQKLSLSPWDMDGTWGQTWDGSHNKFDPSTDFATWMKTNQNIHNLYRRLMETNLQNWNDSLAIRYRQLRSTSWSVKNIMNHFTNYTNLLKESGAFDREMTIWNNKDFKFDFDAEEEYVRNYVTIRLAALDKAYKYIDTGIDNVDFTQNSNNFISAKGGQGCILIHANDPVKIPLFSLSGKLIKNVEIINGLTQVNDIPAGIYIIAKQKVIVR